MKLYEYKTKRIQDFWLSISLLEDSELRYLLSEEPDLIPFDLAEALFCFAQDYNDDNPLINQIRTVLHEVEFVPSMSMSTSELEGYAEVIYKELEDGDAFYYDVAEKHQVGILKCPF